MQIAAHRRAQWREWWCNRPDSIMLTTQRAREIEKQAREENLAEPTLEGLEMALCTFKEDRANGLDGAGPAFYKALPR